MIKGHRQLLDGSDKGKYQEGIYCLGENDAFRILEVILKIDFDSFMPLAAFSLTLTSPPLSSQSHEPLAGPEGPIPLDGEPSEVKPFELPEPVRKQQHGKSRDRG